MKFLVTEPENLTWEALYAKERDLIADVKEELRQGRRCQVYASYTGDKDVALRLETVLRREGLRVAALRSSVPTDVEITMTKGPFLTSDFTATKFSPCMLLRGSCSTPYTEYFEAA